jgi:predicted TIM-barrel fold metal-dependent hydrolase
MQDFNRPTLAATTFQRGHLDRTAARAIVEQVWVSTSGYSSLPAFLAALMTFGADHLLFSVDYPFGNNSAAVDFLKQLPVSPKDRQRIAHQNADALLRLSSAV